MSYRKTSARLYRWLVQEARPVRSRELWALSGVSKDACYQSLHRMVLAGQVERISRGTYRAVPAHPYIDGRGLVEASLKALRGQWPQRKAKVASPKPVTELERCWGFLPIPNLRETEEV